MPVDPLLAAPRLLEVGHVAHRLSVSPGKVRKLIRSGKLPAVRLGGLFRIREAAVDAYIDALPPAVEDDEPHARLTGAIAREERQIDHLLSTTAGHLDDLAGHPPANGPLRPGNGHAGNGNGHAG